MILPRKPEELLLYTTTLEWGISLAYIRMNKRAWRTVAQCATVKASNLLFRPK